MTARSARLRANQVDTIASTQEEIDSLVELGDLEMFEESGRWVALYEAELVARSRTLEGLRRQLLGKTNRSWADPNPLFSDCRKA